MSDDVIQTGPSSYLLKITFTEGERALISARLNDAHWKIDPNQNKEWGISDRPQGRYYCPSCDIRTDGIPLSPKGRKCPICKHIFVE